MERNRSEVVGIEVTHSPDDGGWFAVVFAWKDAIELYETKIHQSESGAHQDAVAWCQRNRPNAERVRTS